MKNHLYARALKLLAGRPYSVAGMKQKLSRFAGPDAVREIVDRLMREKLLDDLNFSYHRASYRVRTKHWGPQRARQDLKRHRVSDSVIELALDRVFTEISEQETLAAAYLKWSRLHGTAKDLRSARRLHGFLRRSGFRQALVMDFLRSRMAEASAFEETE